MDVTHFQVMLNSSMLHNNLVHPSNPRWQSKMNNDNEGVPGLIYGDTGQDGLEEKGLDEPGLAVEEHGEDEQGAAATQEKDSGQANIELSTIEGYRISRDAIIFTDDSPEVASAALSSDAMFDGERLKHTLEVYLVDERKHFDGPYMKLNGKNSIFARPWVIHQWLVALIAVHPHYKSFTIKDEYPQHTHDLK
jgi:hypothetical protein